MVVINNENDTVGFSSANGGEKENFIENLIKKQLQIAAFLANEFGESQLLGDFIILMNHIKESNVAKMLSDKLNGLMHVLEFTRHFIDVITN